MTRPRRTRDAGIAHLHALFHDRGLRCYGRLHPSNQEHTVWLHLAPGCARALRAVLEDEGYVVHEAYGDMWFITLPAPIYLGRSGSRPAARREDMA